MDAAIGAAGNGEKIMSSDAIFYMAQFVLVDFGGKRMLFEEVYEGLDACELKLVADLTAA